MPDATITVVVCGAPLAARAAEVVDALRAAGRDVSVVRTAAAARWFPEPPRAPVERPRANQVVAFPLSFNTANKVALGVMDNAACGVLCDALGAGVPVTAVPMVNDRLWGHPVWATTLDTFACAGVRFVSPVDGRIGRAAPVRSGSGSEVVAAFDPAWVVTAIT